MLKGMYPRVGIGAAVAVAGFAWWFATSYAFPMYHYESSDRGFSDSEFPVKGRDFAVVTAHFDTYKARKADSTITLCRTTQRTWSSPNLWLENLTHPRWDLEYISPSPQPNKDWSMEAKHVVVSSDVVVACGIGNVRRAP